MPASIFAHAVGGGSLPAPPWLLSYIGVFGMALTAVALRSSWATPRLQRFAADPPPDGPVETVAGPTIGQLLGIVLFGLALTAAIIGPDDPAANIAPVAVLVVWWVGLPILCLLLGDVMRAINPFVGLVALAARLGRTPEPADPPPAWVPAAFLGGFGWFFLAYHRPGSPRSLAVFLLIYLAAAIAAGRRYGSGWLRTGEGFGALSAAVARLSRRGGGLPVPGVVPLMIVWVGGTLFDGVTNTPFWVDVIGTSTGWSRTAYHSVGLVWMTAVAAGVVLGALRAADWFTVRSTGEPQPVDLLPVLGFALVPLATGWFLAHDLTLLLFEGQNFITLLSDPLGEGWDLFGTIDQTINTDVVQATWVRWVQLGALAIGHVAAVVIAHDLALHRVGRRRGMIATWAMAATAGASIVAAALLVLQ